jgi:hypothetical protein
MSDFNDNVSEQGSDIEQVGGQAEYDSENDSDIEQVGGEAEYDSEYDSDTYMEGGMDSLDARRGAQRAATVGAKIVTAPVRIPLRIAAGVLGVVSKETGITYAASAAKSMVVTNRYPIVDSNSVNQNNISKHVIHDPGFRRAVKTATNPVVEHGITQYEAFELFDGFKTCTEELLDELIKYFKQALSEQNLFTNNKQWKTRYANHKGGIVGNIRGAAIGKLMVTKADEETSDKESKDNAIAFTENVEAFRKIGIMGKTLGSDTKRSSAFDKTDAKAEEGNRSYRYPQGWKKENKNPDALKNKKISSYKFTDSVNDDKANENYPTFLKLMNEKEIIAMLEHLLNIKKLLSITTDINMARNFMKPDIGNPNSSGGSNAQKINYLEAMNMTEEEDRINDNLFDGSARVDNSKPSWGKNDILKKIYLTDSAAIKSLKTDKLVNNSNGGNEELDDNELGDEDEDEDEEEEEEERGGGGTQSGGSNPDTKENNRNIEAFDLYYTKKHEPGITISLPPAFLINSLVDKEIRENIKK